MSCRRDHSPAHAKHTYQVLQGLFAAALQGQAPAVLSSCPGALDSTLTAAEAPAAEAPAAEMYCHVLTEAAAEVAAEAAAGWVQGMSGTAAAAAAWHALGLLAGCCLCCHWRSGGTALLHPALHSVATAAAAERVEKVPRFVPLEGHSKRADGAWALLQAARACWWPLPWRQSLDPLVARWLQAGHHLLLTAITTKVLGNRPLKHYSPSQQYCPRHHSVVWDYKTSASRDHSVVQAYINSLL